MNLSSGYLSGLTLNLCKLSAEEFYSFVCSVVHKVCPLVKFLVIWEGDLGFVISSSL